jgi:hypothetical protein
VCNEGKIHTIRFKGTVGKETRAAQKEKQHTTLKINLK